MYFDCSILLVCLKSKKGLRFRSVRFLNGVRGVWSRKCWIPLDVQQNKIFIKVFSTARAGMINGRRTICAYVRRRDAIHYIMCIVAHHYSGL